jgi:hypothetical protein
MKYKFVVILIIASVFMTIGCAGGDRDTSATPTPGPTPAPSASPTPSPSPAPGEALTTGGDNLTANVSLPSDLLEEDLESMPELGFPTPPAMP